MTKHMKPGVRMDESKLGKVMGGAPPRADPNMSSLYKKPNGDSAATCPHSDMYLVDKNLYYCPSCKSFIGA